MKTITKQDYNKLLTYKAQAQRLEEMQSKLVDKALEITGEAEVGGYTFDYILNNFGTLDELLNRFDIDVV